MNGLLQFFHASESAAANGLLAQFGKPTLNQIKPTGTGGYEVQNKPGVFSQPLTHPRVPVRRIVVENDVQLDCLGKLGIQSLEELQKLLVTMPWIAFADDSSLDDL